MTIFDMLKKSLGKNKLFCTKFELITTFIFTILEDLFQLLSSEQGKNFKMNFESWKRGKKRKRSREREIEGYVGIDIKSQENARVCVCVCVRACEGHVFYVSASHQTELDTRSNDPKVRI